MSDICAFYGDQSLGKYTVTAATSVVRLNVMTWLAVCTTVGLA